MLLAQALPDLEIELLIVRRVLNLHAFVVVRSSLLHHSVDELLVYCPVLIGVFLRWPLEFKLFEVGVERGNCFIALMVVVGDDAGALEDDAFEVLQ